MDTFTSTKLATKATKAKAKAKPEMPTNQRNQRNTKRARTQPKPKAKPKAKAEQRATSILPTKRLIHIHCWFTNTHFNILPPNFFNPIIQSHLTQIPTNFKQRHILMTKEFPLTTIQPWIEDYKKLDWTEWSKEKSQLLRKANQTIMKYRFLFRKLLHHYRYKKLQQVNTEDIVTLAVPKKKIELVDWSSKQKYVYEAHTLMKDITCRLLTHDGVFENPQYPRNPYTNTHFTQAQYISIWNSILEKGINISSVFLLFRKAKFILRDFYKYNSTFLKLNALQHTMKDTKSYDYNERMLDFITYCYAEEIVPCNTAAFKHFLQTYPDNLHLKKWANLCYKFYEAEIIYVNDPLTLLKLKDILIDSAVVLMNSDKYIINIYDVSM